MCKKIYLFLFFLTITLNINLIADTVVQYKFEIVAIDSVNYFSLKKKFYQEKPKYEMIEDIDSVKQILGNRIKLGEYHHSIIEIRPEKCKPMSFIDGELSFLGYFPNQHILYLEGGHSSDVSYDMITGDSTENIGIPFYAIASPSNIFRINGYWSGQECSFFFMQKKVGDRFVKIADIEDSNLCNFTDAFWTDDHTFYYRLQTYDVDGNLISLPLFYQLRIKED